MKKNSLELSNKENKKESLLIKIYSNTIAGIRAFNQNIALADILNDGNNRLICADIDNNLKVFKDNMLQSEAKLPVCPVAIVTFFSTDQISKSVIPFLAVAGGEYLYIYKNLKGTTKSKLPLHELNSEESAIYDDYKENKIDTKTCLRKLGDLKAKLKNITNEQMEDEIESALKNLSSFTMELLSIKDEKKQLVFLEENKGRKIIISNYITCLKALPKSGNHSTPAVLLVGTETGTIIAIDPAGSKVQAKIFLPEVPFILEATGGFEGDHSIYVADRGNSIYIIGRNNQISNTITVSQNMVNMVLSNRNIIIGTMGKLYESYDYIGNKKFSVTLPNWISTMEIYESKKENNLFVTIIALKNKEVRFYNNGVLMNIINVNQNIFGMKCGKFGETDNCIVLLTYDGALFVCQFNQDINMSSMKYNKEEAMKEGELILPKKTPMYRDLVNREKESYVDMQNKFQRDLLKLRYKAMDTFVKMLKIGNAPQNYSSSSTMKISASLQGLGPSFKLNLILDNVGEEPIANSQLTLDFNRKQYMFEKENIQLGIIFPNIPIKYSLSFRNISESGSSGMVKVIIIDKARSAPLIMTTIKVPIAELEMF